MYIMPLARIREFLSWFLNYNKDFRISGALTREGREEKKRANKGKFGKKRNRHVCRGLARIPAAKLKMRKSVSGKIELQRWRGGLGFCSETGGHRVCRISGILGLEMMHSSLSPPSSSVAMIVFHFLRKKLTLQTRD